MTEIELFEDQITELQQFAAEESARLLQEETSGKKSKRKDQNSDTTLRVVQEFVKGRDWPEWSAAKDWLVKADPTRKLGLAEGLGLYKHEALQELFDAFKETDVSDCIAQVRRVGYRLSQDGIQVMRYNALVLSFVTGTYWSGGVPGAGSQIGCWVRAWWQGLPAWSKSGPPVRKTQESQA